MGCPSPPAASPPGDSPRHQPPAAIAVSRPRVAFDLWQRDGDCLFDPKEATCEAVIGPGVSLREAWHAAVDTAVDRIEEMKRAG